MIKAGRHKLRGHEYFKLKSLFGSFNRLFLSLILLCAIKKVKFEMFMAVINVHRMINWDVFH